MKLIFLGPPGAGKGTQAARIAGKAGIAHISTGDMLRAEIREGTELGKAAEAIIDRGELISDDIIVGMVRNRIRREDCKNGFLLDGFPRTIVQADALSEITTIDRVINIEVQTERLVARSSGRRMCPDCGASYHISTYSSETCTCGGKLYQRDDDTEETVLNRIRVYAEKTKPLIDYYREKGNLVKVDGNKAVEEVTKEIVEVLPR